jgi:hypothetical protein
MLQVKNNNTFYVLIFDYVTQGIATAVGKNTDGGFLKN